MLHQIATPTHTAPEFALQTAVLHAGIATRRSPTLGGLGSPDDLVDLPPAFGSGQDQGELRVVSGLYLASELEAAGLIPSVETLAGLFASGSINADLRSAGELLMRFWQARSQRFTAKEREAFFARLFGSTDGATLAVDGARNVEFENLMLTFAEAIHKAESDVAAATPDATAPLRIPGEALAGNLVPRSGGMAQYAAQEIVRTLHQAIEILKLPEMQHAFGTNSLWDLVRFVVGRYMGGANLSPDNHFLRGKAGMALLSWLADNLPQLEQAGAVSMTPTDPVFEAATEWLEASLGLAELRSKAADARAS